MTHAGSLSRDSGPRPMRSAATTSAFTSSRRYPRANVKRGCKWSIVASHRYLPTDTSGPCKLQVASPCTAYKTARQGSVTGRNRWCRVGSARMHFAVHRLAFKHARVFDVAHSRRAMLKTVYKLYLLSRSNLHHPPACPPSPPRLATAPGTRLSSSDSSMAAPTPLWGSSTRRTETSPP